MHENQINTDVNLLMIVDLSYHLLNIDISLDIPFIRVIVLQRSKPVVWRKHCPVFFIRHTYLFRVKKQVTLSL